MITSGGGFSGPQLTLQNAATPGKIFIKGIHHPSYTHDDTALTAGSLTINTGTLNLAPNNQGYTSITASSINRRNDGPTATSSPYSIGWPTAAGTLALTSDIKVTGVKGSAESTYRTGNVNLTAANVGAVPTTRTVNSKALSANITLSASDVGAVSLTANNTISGIKTFTSTDTQMYGLRLKNTSNYGCKLYFGDDDYVYLHEDSDDHLTIYSKSGITFKGFNEATLFSCDTGILEANRLGSLKIFTSGPPDSARKYARMIVDAVPRTYMFASSTSLSLFKIGEEYTGTNMFSDIGVTAPSWCIIATRPYSNATGAFISGISVTYRSNSAGIVQPFNGMLPYNTYSVAISGDDRNSLTAIQLS